jgi:predicted methyltransferase
MKIHLTSLFPIRFMAILALIVPLAISAETLRSDDRLDQVLAGEHRDSANRARDVYRHPKETLGFFGLTPKMTVVEVSPGRGWYTEILAPVLRDSGKLYAAGYAPQDTGLNENQEKMRKEFTDKLKARPDLYDQVIMTSLQGDMAPPDSADLVVTFRNIHNWIANGSVDTIFSSMFRALKPGGVLGIVEHRAKPGTPLEQMGKIGYVTEDYVITAAEKAGFKLAEKSEINANPKDTKDYPQGVWTLPPSLRLGDQDRAKYLAIGESDRMTLKFIKPASLH